MCWETSAAWAYHLTLAAHFEGYKETRITLLLFRNSNNVSKFLAEESASTFVLILARLGLANRQSGGYFDPLVRC